MLFDTVSERLGLGCMWKSAFSASSLAWSVSMLEQWLLHSLCLVKDVRVEVMPDEEEVGKGGYAVSVRETQRT